MLYVGKQGAQPVVVGALASVFGKSNAEPKSETKASILRYKSIVRIVTFNVRTLNTINQLTYSAAEHNIDFICV